MSLIIDLCYYPRFFMEHHDMVTHAQEQLETFPNPSPERTYTIRIATREFTCLCPKTGQPDFAKLTFEYIPDAHCVELKSLKLYLWSYRQQGAFHEAITNQILDDLVAVISPRFMRVTAKFNVRGGLQTSIIAEHTQPGWRPAHN